MHLYRLCISVTFLSRLFMCFAEQLIHDISDECVHGQILTTYLTNDMGISDAYVAIVAKQGLNCRIDVKTDPKYKILMVVEFLDWYPGVIHCSNYNNEVNIMFAGEVHRVCEIMRHARGDIYRIMGNNFISIEIKSRKDLKTVKIIATSMSETTHGRCKGLFIPCKYEGKVYCMTKDAACDGHLNCGTRDAFDENRAHCKGYNMVNFGMVLIGSVIVFVTFCMTVAILKRLLPNREGTFVVTEDETLSEKDRARSEKEYLVDVRILYESGVTATDKASIEELAHEEMLHRKFSPWKLKKHN